MNYDFYTMLSKANQPVSGAEYQRQSFKALPCQAYILQIASSMNLLKSKHYKGAYELKHAHSCRYIQLKCHQLVSFAHFDCCLYKNDVRALSLIGLVFDKIHDYRFNIGLNMVFTIVLRRNDSGIGSWIKLEYLYSPPMTG